MKRHLTLVLGVAAALLCARPAMAEDEAPQEESGPQLRLYGFGDVDYTLPLNHNPLYNNHGAMYVGNLNLYLDAQISQRLRALTEIRFTYHPTSNTQSTQTFDYNGQIWTTWGSIVIERAWIEYAQSDLLAVRAGQFLTPYGIWNVDHGSPTLLTIGQPKLIASELFPKQQVGLEIYGARYLGDDLRLGYHLTVSNGRIGTNPAYTNRNGRAAFGARLFAETGAVGNLRVGVSGYNGRYTGFQTVTAGGFSTSVMAEQYDETAFAGDLVWRWKGLSLNGEVIGQRFEQTEAGKAAAAAAGNPFVDSSDHLMLGGYGTIAYELPWFGITPWLMYDVLKPNTDGSAIIRNVASGITVRARADLAVKIQLNHITSANFAAMPKLTNELAAQVAYAF